MSLIAVAGLLFGAVAVEARPLSCRGPALKVDWSRREEFGIEMPRMKKAVHPDMPAIVRKRKVQVTIKLEGVIDTEGRFGDVAILSCDVRQGAMRVENDSDVCVAAADAAEAAVRQSTYEPVTRYGEPTCVTWSVRVDLNAEQQTAR